MNRSLLIFLFFLIPTAIFSQNIDVRLLRLINSEETLNSDKYFRFITNSDAYAVIGTPVILASAGLIRDDDKMLRNAFVMAAASIINAGVTGALKYSINRERPFETYPDIVKKANAGSPSFPSGHTSSAFATAYFAQPVLSQMVCYCTFFCLCRNSCLFEDVLRSSLSF